MFKQIIIACLSLTVLLCGTISKSAETTIGAQCGGEIFRSEWHPLDFDSLDVVIVSFFEQSLGACVRKLKITKHISLETVHSEEMAERPVAIWPMGDRLLTLWESGSAFWISVYEIKNFKISKVLDVRSKGIPELAFSKNGSEGIIVNRYAMVENAATGATEAIPKNADIYIWRVDKYEVHSNIPWVQRFKIFVD